MWTSDYLLIQEGVDMQPDNVVAGFSPRSVEAARTRAKARDYIRTTTSYKHRPHCSVASAGPDSRPVRPRPRQYFPPPWGGPLPGPAPSNASRSPFFPLPPAFVGLPAP